jgi:hypothetical protein
MNNIYFYIHTNLLHRQTTQALIKGISLLWLDIGQMANGYFVDNSFLTILEDKELVDSTIHCILILMMPRALNCKWIKPNIIGWLMRLP